MSPGYSVVVATLIRYSYGAGPLIAGRWRAMEVIFRALRTNEAAELCRLDGGPEADEEETLAVQRRRWDINARSMNGVALD